MQHDIRIVTEADLRAAVPLDGTTVDAIERAFAALADGEVVMPPILSMDLPAANAEVDIKTAFVPGLDGFAVKVSPGFFDNPISGLPSLTGLMILLCARTGRVRAVFLDNGYLTDLRTAAAGAVAARHLALPHVETAGVIGTGAQARLQMQAAHLERPFRRLLVWGRDPAKAAICAADLGGRLGVEAEVMTSAGDVVRESQLVVTATPARVPLVRAEWLHPGLHITAVGSDQPGKQEIAPEAVACADLYVADRADQCETAGEMEGVRAAGLANGAAPELGQIVTRSTPGRATLEAITICDLTGTGAQDTAIASHAGARLGATGTLIRA
jgi:ornithine cyclodeaminase